MYRHNKYISSLKEENEEKTKPSSPWKKINYKWRKKIKSVSSF
jgi:hypothetical protein